MIDRTRMLLDDLDSEGFPIPDPSPFVALNLGRAAAHAVVQALLADHKCLNCQPPRDNVGLYDVQDHLADVFTGQRDKGDVLRAHAFAAQYKGLSVDAQGHVVVGSIDVAAERAAERAKRSGYDTHRGIANAWADDAREMVRAADLQMDGVACVSDMLAHEAFFGWKR